MKARRGGETRKRMDEEGEDGDRENQKKYRAVRQQHLPIPSDKTEVFYVYSFGQIILRLIYRSDASV